MPAVLDSDGLAHTYISHTTPFVTSGFGDTMATTSMTTWTWVNFKFFDLLTSIISIILAISIIHGVVIAIIAVTVSVILVVAIDVSA